MLVRPAAAHDAARLAAIYNQGIEDRVATFETSPRSADDLVAWFESGLPFLVAEQDGEIVGFARVSPYSDRCVYGGVGEHGVYVDRAARGSGTGRALLEALCAAAEEAGLYKLVALIFTDNIASVVAHRRAGFSEVGVFRRHGTLDGIWKDVVVLERLLGPAVP